MEAFVSRESYSNPHKILREKTLSYFTVLAVQLDSDSRQAFYLLIIFYSVCDQMNL